MVLVLAFMALGLAHWSPALAILAWLAMAGIAFGLRGGCRPGMMAALLAIGGTAELWIAHPWQWNTAQLYANGRHGVEVLFVVGFTIATVIPKLLPVFAAWWGLGRRLPVTVLFPIAWLSGEWLRDQISRMSYNDWLNTQWQVPPVLKLVGHLGWNGALVICLVAAAAIGETIGRRSWRLLPIPLAAGLLMTLLPALPRTPAADLASVGAVHMDNYFYPPKSAPPGIRLMVWPEQANYQRPVVSEGPGNGHRIDPPFPSSTVSHMFGLITRTPQGRQNAVLLVAPDGAVVRSRAKRRLFPLAERPFLGLLLPQRFTLLPGTAPAVLETPVGPAVSLLCQEGLERDFVEAEARRGARWLTLSACEQLFDHSTLAMEQFTGVSVLLAVDTGLPVIRASLYGQAAIIDRDGTVLATSKPRTDGLLTVDSDIVTHAGPIR